MTRGLLASAGGGALLGLCLVSAASAQEGTLVEPLEVVAAGPRITDANSTSPVSVLDADAIAAGGATSLEQALTSIPALGFQGVSGSQNTGGYGAAFADLRNLNFNRTVVVVNGRRFVLSGITTDEAVDLNNIPVALIDHVEVLRDGSQPEFGADAVAGVINIVLRDDFNGVAMSALGSVSSRGDAGAADLSVVAGRNFARGNVTGSLAYTHREPVRQADRPWARNPITSATFGPGGALELERGLTATPGGHVITAGGANDLALGGGRFRPFDEETDNYDPSAVQYLQGGIDRYNATVSGHLDLGGNVTLFGEGLYSTRTSDTRSPPVILGVAGTNLHPEGFVIPGGNPANPYGEDVTLQRVLEEVGPQATRTRADTGRVVIGLRGDNAGLEWSAAYNHGETRQSFTTRNAVNLTRALQTVSGDPADCLAARGCVPGDYFGPGSLSPAAADYIRYTALGRSLYREDIATVSAERVLRTTRAGEWELTLGAEHRVEVGRVTPDAVTLAGDQAGADSAPTDGRVVSSEAYVDLDLPLRSQEDVGGALRLDLAARYSRYGLFGAFPTWRAAAVWSPTRDLRIRASIGHARRIPAITEAFGGSTASLLAVTDPCDSVDGETDNPTVAANCLAAGLPASFTQNSPLIAIANGGSAALRPESSRNLTVGLVWTPAPIPGLSVTADYYRVRIADAIDSLADTDPNFIPDQCYESVGLSSRFCGLITRTPSGPNAGQINLIFAPDANLGEIFSDGVDVSVNWRGEVGALGRLSVDWETTYLLNYLIRGTPGAAPVQYAGTFPGLNFVGSYPHWRSVLTLGLDHGPWSFGAIARYIGEADVLDADPAEEAFTHARAVTYIDLEASYTLGRATFSVGIDNVGDVTPPRLIDGATNTNLNTYDAVGRVFFARASARF
jgi:iron complex outermembrane receptor protein